MADRLPYRMKAVQPSNEFSATVRKQIVALYESAIGGDLSSKESLTSYEWRLDDLRIRLQSMIREGNPTAASDASRYLDYLGTLREIVRLVTSPGNQG